MWRCPEGRGGIIRAEGRRQFTIRPAWRPRRRTGRAFGLDILRGVAIYGILLYNVDAFAGYEFLTGAQQAALPFSAADPAADFLLEFLVAGKFYSLFSFLFGVGFFVFMPRAAARGADPVRLFKRRLVGLTLIALAHTLLIWMGDILLTYAVLGFALIRFVRRDDRTVRRWALIWLAAPIPLYLVLLGLARFATPPTPGADDSLPPILMKAIDGFARGNYLDIVRGNALFTAAGVVRRLVLMFFPRVLGMFLLGFYAARLNVFATLDEHRTLVRNTFALGLAIGLPLAFAGAVLGDSTAPRFPTVIGLFYMIAETIGTPALSLAYAAGICLLFQRAPRAMRAFAPVGRMALSNYLLHSVAGVLIFYGIGFGLWGRVSLTVLLAGATVFFGLQMMLSRWWLSVAAFGPAEWVWRMFTYKRRFRLFRVHETLGI